MYRGVTFVVLLLCSLGVTRTNAQQHTSVVLSYAEFDVFKQRHTVPELRVEIRQDLKSSFMHPLAGVMGNFHGGRFYYVGVYTDLKITDGLYITPSFAPGFYSKCKRFH